MNKPKLKQTVTIAKSCCAAAASLLLLALPAAPALAQVIETSSYRVVTNLDIRLPVIGTVQSRSTDEITGSNWLLGCETLDRDFADYDQYKEYIAPLGIKRLRMQAGWNKTEKVKGQYDFAWLDHIVNDATRRGFKPWLQTSYGNVLYAGGGGANLGAPQLLVLSQDTSAPEEVRAFLEKRKIGLEAYQDSEMAVSSALGTQILPTTILYGSDGKEVWRFVGDLDWTGAKAAELLKEAR